MKTAMDNNFTGIPKMDYVLLGGGWIGGFLTLSALPIILSSIASALVILNQYYIYKNRKKKNDNGSN